MNWVAFLIVILASPILSATPPLSAKAAVRAIKKEATCYAVDDKFFCYAKGKAVAVVNEVSVHVARVESAKTVKDVTTVRFGSDAVQFTKDGPVLSCSKSRMKKLRSDVTKKLLKNRAFKAPGELYRVYVRKLKDGRKVVVSHPRDDKKYEQVRAWIWTDAITYDVLKVKSARRNKITKSLDVSLENGGRIVTGGINKKLVTKASFRPDSSSDPLPTIGLKKEEVHEIQNVLRLWDGHGEALPLCFVKGHLPY